MKEKKFRAWIESEQSMVYQGTPDLETLQSFIFHYGDLPLMQGLGIKDKNGVEIYEGDIVKVTGEEPYSNEQFSTDYDWVLTGEVVMESLMWVIKDPWDNSIPFCDIINGDIDMRLRIVGRGV